MKRPSTKSIRKAFAEHLTVGVDGYEQSVWDIMEWGGLSLAIDFLQEQVHKGEDVGVVSDYEHMSELGVEESIKQMGEAVTAGKTAHNFKLLGETIWLK